LNSNLFDVLKERGFVKQCSDHEGLIKKLNEEKVVYYVGFDPTADSLHVGSLLPIMAMAHLQKAGHFPVCIIGGGTAMIGDPSGKTEMRRVMSSEEIANNNAKIVSQLKKYLILDGESGTVINNADWLLDLNYIKFLRDIGRYFKVNEMIKAESYKQRLDRQEGLSFTEFNYQILQAYDFFVLFDRHNCVLQLGGDDQWGNMIAGINLVRIIRSKKVYGLTFPLLVTARGNKMGKTEAGTIWLDPLKTSPYDFYQFWINTDDKDVIRFLNLFTFLPHDDVVKLKKLKGQEIRVAKEILAFEVTKLVHGQEEAIKAEKSGKTIFSNLGNYLESIPTSRIEISRIKEGLPIVDLLCEICFCKTKSEARRLISQGGISLNGEKVNSLDLEIKESFFDNFTVIIRRGKKQYHRLILEGETK